MNRRRFLTGSATATLTAVAGCLEGGTPPDSTGDPTDEATDTPTPTQTGPELTDTSFEVTDVSCGSQGTDSQVTIGDERVTVEGTLDGRDSCYTAELVRSEYDGEGDTLFVEVEAVQRDDADTCTMCIVEIDYAATVEFDGGEPGTVKLTQRGALTESESETGSGSATPDATATSDGNSDY